MVAEIGVERLAADRLHDAADPVDVDAVFPALARIEHQRHAYRRELARGGRRHAGRLDVADHVGVPDLVAEAGRVGEQVTQRDRPLGRTQLRRAGRVESFQHLRRAERRVDIGRRHPTKPGTSLASVAARSTASIRPSGVAPLSSARTSVAPPAPTEAATVNVAAVCKTSRRLGCLDVRVSCAPPVAGAGDHCPPVCRSKLSVEHVAFRWNRKRPARGWSPATRAQRQSGVWRHFAGAFHELCSGGRNVQIDYRWAGSNADRMQTGRLAARRLHGGSAGRAVWLSGGLNSAAL